MLIGKIIGLIIFGAITAMPAHVLFGSLLAPWKVRERNVLVMSAVFSYAVVWMMIFGTDGPLDEAGTRSAITAIERSKADLMADLHRERQECKALAISLSAEPIEFHNKQYTLCMEGVRASTEALSATIKDMDSRIDLLRGNIK